MEPVVRQRTSSSSSSDSNSSVEATDLNVDGEEITTQLIVPVVEPVTEDVEVSQVQMGEVKPEIGPGIKIS